MSFELTFLGRRRPCSRIGPDTNAPSALIGVASAGTVIEPYPPTPEESNGDTVGYYALNKKQVQAAKDVLNEATGRTS